MTITIRAAQDRDLDFLVAMNRLVHDLHLAAEPACFRQPEREVVAELFRARMGQPETRVWIASLGEVPAGYAVAAIRERPENALCTAQRFVELEEIGVAPVHRQQGGARALVEHVLPMLATKAFPTCNSPAGRSTPRPKPPFRPLASAR